MITTGSLSKWMLASFGGLALSYNVLQVPDAPPLAGPPSFTLPPTISLEPPHIGTAIAAAPLPVLEERTAQWLYSRDGSILNEQEQHVFGRMNARRGEPLMTEEEFLQVINTPSAIMPATGTVASSDLPVDRRDQIEEVIHFSRGKLETLFAGDEMYIFSQRLGYSLIMVVDQVEDHQDGSMTWHGHIKDLPPVYRVSFTQGPQFTLADILTPKGHYQLQARGDYGWISQGPHLPPDQFKMASHTGYAGRSLN